MSVLPCYDGGCPIVQPGYPGSTAAKARSNATAAIMLHDIELVMLPTSHCFVVVVVDISVVVVVVVSLSFSTFRSTTQLLSNEMLFCDVFLGSMPQSRNQLIVAGWHII